MPANDPLRPPAPNIVAIVVRYLMLRLPEPGGNYYANS